MEPSTLILEQFDDTRLVVHLQEFVRQVEGATVFLMDRDGSCLCRVGNEAAVINDDVLCALSAGAFVASKSLAELAGENEFRSIALQGKRCHIYVTMVGPQHLLMILYEDHVSNVVVRMTAKVTAEMILYTLEKAFARKQSQKGGGQQPATKW